MSEQEWLERLRQLELQNARLESRAEALDKEMSALSKDLEKFNTGVARGLWLIGGGFISAIVAWILNGGLSNGGN